MSSTACIACSTVAATTLRRGSKGEDVKKLQTLLRNKGYVLAVDGDFGPTTEKCVKDFQNTKHLQPDGIVGPKTWTALIG